MSYFDLNLDLTAEDKALRDAARAFAKDVARPIGIAVDRMTAAEAVAETSPVWEFLREGYRLGYHKALFPEALGGLGLTPLQGHLIMEELFWGSLGLGGILLLSTWPFMKVLQTGDPKLIKEFVLPFCACSDASIRGCWGIMEPDHGSDHIGQGEAFYTDPGIKGQVRARLDGDTWVINGDKAAWVSAAPLATVAMLNVHIDGGMGLAGGGTCMVPLDLPGVSKGRPLEKVGQRDLPQGSLIFDDVRIPRRYMFCGPDAYADWVANNLGFGNSAMGVLALGLARAGFEEAYAYAKTRVQGGKPLADHYAMKIRIHRMFTKVEAIRAMSRAVWNLTLNIYPPASEYGYAAKIFCTEAAREVIEEAVQIHGANGLTKEYFIEKIWRDSRALTIEDGVNDVLARLGGELLNETFPRASVNRVT
jgi:alkylation response protein AidB-like acyl-CoA dehydrogenase